MKKYEVKRFLWTRPDGNSIPEYGITVNGACVCLNPFYSYRKAIKYILDIESGKISEPGDDQIKRMIKCI